jgi:predicted metal-dependent hydrolase
MKSDDAWQLLERGIALYNAGEFFECHEVLEALWRADSSEYRDLYQGLIKAAVTFYHAQRGNFAGAGKVLQSSLRQLRPYLNRQTPLELAAFVQALERALRKIEHCERTGVPFEKNLIPTLHWNRHLSADRHSERSS